jgi:hypothetical protein
MKLIRARGLLALMLHVAIVAFMAVGTRYYVVRDYDLGSSKKHYQELAAQHATNARMMEGTRDGVPDQAISEWAAGMARYHREMERKYSKAALNPGEDVPADPPPPL